MIILLVYSTRTVCNLKNIRLYWNCPILHIIHTYISISCNATSWWFWHSPPLSLSQFSFFGISFGPLDICYAEHRRSLHGRQFTFPYCRAEGERIFFRFAEFVREGNSTFPVTRYFHEGCTYRRALLCCLSSVALAAFSVSITFQHSLSPTFSRRKSPENASDARCLFENRKANTTSRVVSISSVIDSCKRTLSFSLAVSLCSVLSFLRLSFLFEGINAGKKVGVTWRKIRVARDNVNVCIVATRYSRCS